VLEMLSSIVSTVRLPLSHLASVHVVINDASLSISLEEENSRLKEPSEHAIRTFHKGSRKLKGVLMPHYRK
jgi:hypothetical protein